MCARVPVYIYYIGSMQWKWNTVDGRIAKHKGKGLKPKTRGSSGLLATTKVRQVHSLIACVPTTFPSFFFFNYTKRVCTRCARSEIERWLPPTHLCTCTTCIRLLPTVLLAILSLGRYTFIGSYKLLLAFTYESWINYPQSNNEFIYIYAAFDVLCIYMKME